MEYFPINGCGFQQWKVRLSKFYLVMLAQRNQFLIAEQSLKLKSKTKEVFEVKMFNGKGYLCDGLHQANFKHLTSQQQ